MARVVFSSNTELLLGRLAGSVFQDSYFGVQIRTRVTPRNPQTPLQQLRRGEFAFLRTSWRNLTPAQRATWGYPGPPAVTAIDDFTAGNINLALISRPLSLWKVDGEPVQTPSVEITALDTLTFKLKFSFPSNTFQTRTRLAIFVTRQKPPSKLFTNPSDFHPLTYITYTWDLNAELDIISRYVYEFGPIKLGERLCVKVAHISFSTGTRQDSAPVCAIAGAIETYRLISSTGDFLVSSSGDYLVYQ